MSATAPAREFLTPAEVASRLGLTKVDVVRSWISNGELPASNVASDLRGRPTWRIREQDLNDFLERRRTVPAAAEPVRRRRRPRDPEPVTRYF